MAGTITQELSGNKVECIDVTFRFEIFDYIVSTPPVLDAVTCFLDTVDIIRLSWTCRIALEAVRKQFKRAFNFQLHFRRFFHNPISFRRLMARTNAIVTGANTLEFFTRQIWAGSKLDIYVGTTEAKEVCDWLMEEEKYTFVPRDGHSVQTVAEALQTSLEDTSIDPRCEDRTLLDLVRVEGDCKIQVVACGERKGSLAPAYLLLAFHSTCLMNIITHSAAYCLYPALTIRDHVSLVFHPDDSTHSFGVSGAEIYRERGWTALTPDSSLKEEDFMFDIRSIGDRHCWTVKHPPLEDLPDHDLMTLNEWKLDLDKSPNRMVNVGSDPLSARARYSYAHCTFSLRGCINIFDIAQAVEDTKAREYKGAELDWEVYHKWKKLMDPKTLFTPKPRRINPELAHINFWWEKRVTMSEG